MVYVKGTLDDRRNTRKNASYGGVLSESIMDIPFPMAVASRILDSFGFSEIVDSMLDWDPKQCKISPSDALKAIVLATASKGERPAIMNLPLHYQNIPLELMFDTARTPDDLDRFTVSDHLDRLYEAGPGRVYLNVCAAARVYYEIVSRVVHSDTTSVSVWGTYESDYQNDGGIDITRGYSKDKRPDLRQYMVGKAVDDNGISLFSQPLDGNTSDVTWNEMCLDTIGDVIAREDLIYVADSKVVTKELVERVNEAGIRFVSRLPRGFDEKLQRKVLRLTETGDLVKMGKLPSEVKRTDRWYVDHPMESCGTTLRLIPQVTDHSRGKGDKALAKVRDSFERFLASFQTEYNCMKDAVDAFGKFQKKASKNHKMFRVQAEYEEFKTEKRGRGRPRKDGKGVIVEEKVRVVVTYTEDPQVRDDIWKSEEFIVTISNIPLPEDDPDRGMCAEDIIRLYNSQWKVEGQFATMKKPAIADRLFLEKESRAEALVTVFNIGVLIRGLIQLLMRRGIDRIGDEGLPPYGVDGGPLQRNVTHAYFLQQFQNYNIHYYPRAGEYVYPNRTVAERAGFFLDLMGIEPAGLFSG